MQHIYRRCKHCNKEYLYCTYGNGPDWGTEKYCSMDYCGECQKAIDDALSKIPERYSYKMELIPKEDYDYINKTIDTMVRGWLADADRIRVRSNIYSIWLEELVSGENKIANLIKSNYGTSVALYGCGEIGKKLFSYFNHNEIRVKYFIDTQKQGNIENIPIVPLVDNLPEVNIVIVTLTIEEKEVMEKLKNYGVNNVISVRELFLYC